MNKDGTITISNPQTGIANSAILGNEVIIGCNIFEEPGILKIQNALDADSSQINNSGYMTISGVPVADVTNYNSQNELVRTVLTESGQLMSGGNADFLVASNLAQGWDACVWDTNYTVVSYAQSGTGYIGVIYHDPTDQNSTVWNPAEISSLTGTHCIKLLMAQDGYMYFTNGNTIGRITNITGTGSGITVTSSSNVLDLPNNVYALTMTELGSNLLIGTQKGYSYASRQSFNSADIYPWDRTSSSFRLPVKIAENGMNAMISHRNQVYFSAGDDGRIYVTDGTTYQLVKRLPFTKTGKYNPASYVYPNAMCINQQGHLMVGLSAVYSSGSPSVTGIWEIALTQGFPTHLPFFSRDGNLGDSSTVKFGSVRVLNESDLAFGVQSASTYELSVTAPISLNSSYTAKWRTQLYRTGSRMNRKSFNNIEFTLTQPLLENQGIKLSYRKNLKDTFTTIGTFTFADLGGVISHYSKALIADSEMVQLEIALTYSSAVYGSNVNLLNVTLS